MTGQRGFSLLEVIVALVILALVAGAGMAAVAEAAAVAARSADHRQAVMLADDLLTTLAAQEAPTQRAGTEGRFAWRLDVTPLEPTAGPAAAQQLTIEVSWPGAAAPVSLTTIRARRR